MATGTTSGVIHPQKMKDMSEFKSRQGTLPKAPVATATKTATEKAAPKPKSSSQATERRREPESRGAAPGRQRSFPSSPRGTQQPHVGLLIAEWFFGAVIIATTVPLEKTQSGYQSTITTVMVRLTGLTGVFFALALASEIPTARKFVVWFGLLIDIGIVYRGANTGAFKSLSNVFAGTSISRGTTLAADYTASNPTQPSGMATT